MKSLFPETVYDIYPLTLFAKRSIIDISVIVKCVSVIKIFYKLIKKMMLAFNYSLFRASFSKFVSTRSQFSKFYLWFDGPQTIKKA